MMYHTSLTLVLISTMCATICAKPVGLQDIFDGYVKNANLVSPEKQSEIVKRRVFEENPDEGLKRVSLQSLIGDLETNLYQSAIAASSAKQEPIPLKTSDGAHPINKRDNDKAAAKPELSTQQPLTESSEKVIESKNHGPTRIVIDRISVQPHYGDLPSVPAFQLQHTKVTSATNKDTGANATHITITKSDIQATNADASSSTPANKGESSTEKEASTTVAATKKPIEELKKAQAELNEKVAEIEAEPVILSARV